MRILITAYGYSSGDVSESYTAYRLVKQLRRQHQVVVLTKDPVDELEAVQINAATILKDSPYQRALKLDYFSFMLGCYKYAKQRTNQFDLIHHISPISLRYPNILCNLGLPFVWGPVGGTIPYPPGFSSVEAREPWVYKLKVVDRLRLRIDPLMTNTLKKSAAIVTTSHAAKLLIPHRYQAKTHVIPEAFELVDELKVHNSNPKAEIDAPYIFSSGRLVPYKGFEFLVQAFAAMKNRGTVKLVITGDGPDHNYLENIVHQLNVQDSVLLLGRIARDRNIALMQNSQFCVFPGLNEAFGHVNLEAMAAEKPVIVVNWGGPADIIEDGICGFKIPPSSPESLVDNLASKMDLLLGEPTLCNQMGAEAKRRVAEEFSWERIAQQFNTIYSACTLQE